MLLVFAFSMAGIALPVLAEENSAATRTPLVKEERATIKARRDANIRKFFANMARRLENMISRLEQLAGRIESRLKKFEERGADVTGAKEKLAAARTKIVEAKEALTEAKGKLEGVLSSQNSKEAFKEVREGLVKGVVNKIKEAHEALVGATRALKGVKIEN